MNNINNQTLQKCIQAFTNACNGIVLEKISKNHAENNHDDSYSAIMRNLIKFYDPNIIRQFQEQYKKLFDEAIISGNDESKCLDQALDSISNYKYVLSKTASAVELGDPEFAGRYLSALLKFLLRRISPTKQRHAIEGLRRKVYYLNEYQIANKRTPPSASIGQSLTLLKTILLEHSPEYIRAVLNSISRNL